MYGTWKTLNAVAAATNATTTQTAAAEPVSAVGVAKSAANRSGIETAPASRNRRRLPCRAAETSDRAPISGSITTSQSFGTVTTRLASPAATPSVSVR